MSNSIYRVKLEITDYQEIEINAASSLLSVAPQRGDWSEPVYTRNFLGGMIPVLREQGVDLWYINRPETNPDFKQQTKKVGIAIVGTGNEMPKYVGTVHSTFLGTCVMQNNLVWHVFEVPAGWPGETE